MILLKARLGMELPPINKALNNAVKALHPSVQPVARHIFDAGGKRLRPLLVVLMARLLGCTDSRVYELAVCMEMLHAATLLHDDVLDNADSRRGHPAAHTLFGITPTILAGDALLATANGLVARFDDPALCRCFAAATSQTAAGEILEIASQHQVNVTAETYDAIIRGKTAWLIRASCEMGALYAGGNVMQVTTAADYGENVGMAFQLVDDALDFADSAVTGKPSGGDVREGKLTPPLRLYRQHLSPAERTSFDTAFAKGLFSEEDASRIGEAVRRQGFDARTRDEAQDYLDRALMALDRLPQCREQDVLREMTNYVRDRKK